MNPFDNAKKRLDDGGHSNLLSKPLYGDAPDYCKIEICTRVREGITLDIGCLSRIYEPCCCGTYVGVDIFVYDRDKKPDVVCHAQWLPFRDEIFNTILAFDVIEHLPLGDLFVAECFRTLRLNGRAFITTPNGPRSPFAKADPTHVRIYSGTWLRSLLEAAGFHVQPDNLSYVHSSMLGILKKLPYSFGNWLASFLVSNMFVVATKKEKACCGTNLKRLRILALANDPPSYVFGFSLVFIEVCRFLSEAGHNVLLISRAGGAVERVLGESGIELRLDVPGGGSLLGGLLFLLKSIVAGLGEARSYEIVFCCDIECIPGLIIAKLRGLKAAVLFFDVYPLAEWVSSRPSLVSKIITVLMVLATYQCLRFFDVVLCISPYTEQLVRQRKLSKSLIKTVGCPVGEA